MKTLKKTLCLVLAVVMVVGVLILPVNADYADDAKIDPKYETAVNVLTTVGVLEGKTGNNFDPTGILTRSEAAKILAYIKVGKTIAESYPAAGAYSDVPKDNWAAKYIAYGTSQGIINGVGGDKFDPTGTLTGTQLAKMLLVAIEYNATYTSFSIRAGQYFYNKTFDDRYVGDLWEINTITDLSLAGLNVGLETVDLTKSITREQAAQMVLNAVKFQRSTGLWTWVTGPDGTTRYQRELYTQPLLETALDVVVNPYCHDAQGVPYVAWEYQNEEIYTEDYEYVGSYDNAFDKSAYSALKGEGHVWYNGSRDDFAPYGTDDRTVSSLYVSTADTRAKYGLEVDVYAIDIHYTGSDFEYPGDDSWHDHLYSSDGTTYYDIVVKEAYLAKVTYVDEKSVEFDVYEAGRMIGGDGARGCKITSASPYFEDLAKLSKGDYFAAYLFPSWDDSTDTLANVTNYMIDCAELETVTGDITRTVHGKIEKAGNGYAKGAYVACRSTLDVGGETYKVNNEFINLTSKTAGGSAVPEAGNNVTMYLLNGNVLGLKVNKKPIQDNLIMMTDIYLSADANGKVRPTVEGVNTAGEKVKFFVSDDKTNNDIEYHDVNDKDDYIGNVYAYKLSSIKDGCYVFGKLPTSHTRTEWTKDAEWDAFGFINAGKIAKADKTLPAAWAPSITGTTSSNFYYDSNVKFIYSNGAVAEGVQDVDTTNTLVYPVIYLEDGVYYVKAVFVYAKPKAADNSTAYFIEGQTINGDALYSYLDASGVPHKVADVPAWKDGVKTTLKIDVSNTTYYDGTKVTFTGGFYSVKTAFKGSDESTIYAVASASTTNYGAATYVKGANLLVIGTTQYNVKSTTVVINTSNGRELEISDIEANTVVGVEVAKDTSDLTYVYVTND